MNGHPNIDTTEATEHLKNILNVGKSDPAKVKPVSATSMEPSGEAAFDNERPIFQRVELTGSEGNVCIYGTDVSVYPSPVHRSPSSCSNVMMYNIVDYSWEQKYHQGRLVSIHLSKKFMAYALKVPSSTGYVRVIKHSTNNHLLLKGFKGGAKDLSFAHSLTRILLGCIDEVGELHIYEILDEEPRIKARYCVHITRPINTPSSIYHRIVWCPYVPEDTIVMDNNGTSPDDVMMMTSLLIATHDEKAEVWNIDTVMKEYGQGEIPVEKVKNGMRLICEHKKPITAAAFSPDAIALATASLDGEVKFFQVNAQENDGVPKCVHKWTPHDGKPISSLFFLDNHKSYSPDVQFWKFAVTGANNNEELKLWSCKTWTCLQTIRMMSYDSDGTPPCIKADIDLSAGYIFLSDINRMVFYILKVSEAGTTNQAMISSLSEFPIKFPVLSFAVVDVAHCKRKMSFNAKNSADADDEEEEEDDEGERDEEEYDDIMRKYPYLVKLYWINTKSLQFCKILYSPKSSSPLQSVGSMSSSQDSFAYRDGLSDLSTDVPDQPNISSCETDINSNKSIAQTSGLSTVLSSQPALTTSAVASLAPHRSPSYQGCDEVLLTPKDFTSPHAPVPSASIANSYKLGGIQEVTSDITVTGETVSESNISGVSSDQPAPPRRKSSQHSSTSSPSREVAEILSPNQILGHENEIESPKPKKEDEILSPPVGVHPDVICPSPVLNQMSQEYLNSEWPLAPDPPQEYRVPSRSESDIHRPHLPLEQSTRHAMQSLNGERISPNATPIDTSSQWLKRSIEALSLNLTSITDTLHCQSQAIQFIQQEIQELQQQHKYTQKDIRNIDALYNSLISKVEQVVSENSVSEFARVESLLSKHEDCEKQHLEQQSVALSQNLMTSMNKQMDKIIKQEMKNVVMPQMSKCVETLVENFQAEVLQKLNSTDNALKECVGKHLRSKVFSDNLAQAAANILQLSVQNACKDVFQSHVVVSLEKCCQLLFSQMNEVFSSGVAEYTGKLESYHQVMAANFEATANRFQEFAHRLAAEAQNLFMKISEKAQADAASINRQHELLLTRVRQTVQEEVRRAMAENASSIAAAVRSQTSTPAPQNDSQLSPQQLLHLARQGHINDAFQKALSAVDVKLVLFLCENVSVDKVFGPDCAPLAQHVLLSLINQLSGELSEKTEIKVRYIEDAITSLDQDDPVTKEHLGRVAGSLEQRASTFLKQNPNHPMARNVKRILMSINSFDLK